jgi:hypothetical protein
VSLLDHDELAVWYRQAGAPGGFLTTDRVWSVGDRTGAAVGTVFVDGDLFGAPDYWFRDPDESAVLGLTHAAGVLGTVTSPYHRIAWADGNPVGHFQDPWVHWGDQVIAKWKVDAQRKGYQAVFGGAWLWDVDDTPIANVTNEVVDGGAYLALHRVAEVDEARQWATLAFVVVAYEHHRRAEAAAAQARRRRRQRHRR